MYKRVNFERLFIIIYMLSIFLILNIAYGKPLDNLEYGYNALNDNLKVCFEDVSILRSVGADLNNSYAKIIGDNSLVINASNLSYPGAGIEYEAIIKNNGLLPAKLIGINTYGINEDDDIIVRLNDIDKVKDEVLNPGDEYKINIIVMWDSSSTNSNEIIKDFSIELGYEQAL
jgi:hypothetical protein